MPVELINLLVQLPFIAVFIWYVSRRDERDIQRFERQEAQFMATLDRRQSMVDRLTDVVAANTQAMNALRDCLGRQEVELIKLQEATVKKLEEHHLYVVSKHEKQTT